MKKTMKRKPAEPETRIGFFTAEELKLSEATLKRIALKEASAKEAKERRRRERRENKEDIKPLRSFLD